MEFEIISFLIGIQFTVFMLMMIANIVAMNKKRLKWLPLLILMSIFWEIGIPILVYFASGKKRERKNETVLEKIERLKETIRKQNEWYEAKKISFDKLEASIASNYGIAPTAKEKWLVALGDTHTRTIADYVSRLNELEQRSCKS
jgi:hypothetical protein